MKLDFSDKKILVTGGTKGIGFSISEILHELGGDVIALNSKDCDFEKDDIKKFLESDSDFSDIDIEVRVDTDRLRPIDADYQMFDNTKISSIIDWKPEISAKQMFLDLLNHWRFEISKGEVPLNR